MQINKIFKRLFSDKKKFFLILLILAVLSLTFYDVLKKIFIVMLFISLSGISKVYHRFFKSTVGIDFVFFTTALTAFAFHNLFLSLFVGWAGLIIADSLGTKFTHFSIVTLIGLTLISILAQFIGFLPITLGLILLMIIFEIITIIFYSLMGSSADKIIVFFVSHFMFNLFLIITFSEAILKLIT